MDLNRLSRSQCYNYCQLPSKDTNQDITQLLQTKAEYLRVALRHLIPTASLPSTPDVQQPITRLPMDAVETRIVSVLTCDATLQVSSVTPHVFSVKTGATQSTASLGWRCAGRHREDGAMPSYLGFGRLLLNGLRHRLCRVLPQNWAPYYGPDASFGIYSSTDRPKHGLHGCKAAHVRL